MSDTYELEQERENAAKKRRPFAVWCPLCSAPPGKMCRTRGGKESLAHAKRIIATYRR